jgi:hypothetical protein
MALDDKRPPVIISEHGATTESARLQAALNIARDPALRQRMIKRFGEAVLRRNYPEAFDDAD